MCCLLLLPFLGLSRCQPWFVITSKEMMNRFSQQKDSLMRVLTNQLEGIAALKVKGSSTAIIDNKLETAIRIAKETNVTKTSVLAIVNHFKTAYLKGYLYALFRSNTKTICTSPLRIDQSQLSVKIKPRTVFVMDLDSNTFYPLNANHNQFFFITNRDNDVQKLEHVRQSVNETYGVTIEYDNFQFFNKMVTYSDIHQLKLKSLETVKGRNLDMWRIVYFRETDSLVSRLVDDIGSKFHIYFYDDITETVQRGNKAFNLSKEIIHFDLAAIRYYVDGRVLKK